MNELQEALLELRKVTLKHFLRDGVAVFFCRYFGLVFIVSGLASLIVAHERLVQVWAGVALLALGCLLALLARDWARS